MDQRVWRSEKGERPNDLAKPSSTHLCSYPLFPSSLESVSGYIHAFCMLDCSFIVLADTEVMALWAVLFRAVCATWKHWCSPSSSALRHSGVGTVIQAGGSRGCLKSLLRECYSGSSFLLSEPLHGSLGTYPTGFFSKDEYKKKSRKTWSKDRHTKNQHRSPMASGDLGKMPAVFLVQWCSTHSKLVWPEFALDWWNRL